MRVKRLSTKVMTFGVLGMVFLSPLATIADTPSVRLPYLVVTDSSTTPKILGPVVSIDSGRPVVQFDDPMNAGDTFEARVDKSTISFDASNTVYFDAADCQGTVYLKEPDSLLGLGGLRGYSYAKVQFGNPSTGDTFIYRSDAATGGASIAILSRYTGTCTNGATGSGTDKVTGSLIMNFTQTFPPPYHSN